MTDTKQEKPKNLIPKPISQAFLAGMSSSTISFVFGVPLEYAARVALAGAGISLFLSWQDSRDEDKPKKKTKKRSRQIPFNHGRGSQKINMEFSVNQGGYINRESWSDTISHLIFGHRGNKRVDRAIEEPIARPKVLDEFIFISYYQGQRIELRNQHVKLFLSSAWRNRDNGKGLSKRRWDRNRSQRPAWYKELHQSWYFGMSMLIWDCQKGLSRQLVITLDNQQSFLVVEPHELYSLLRWYESKKRE